MLTRRTFLKYTGATTLTLFATTAAGQRVALASLPGGSLDPSAVPKFASPLLIPPVMPRAGTVPWRGAGRADYYEIAMRQFEQAMLPTPLPLTTVWGYGPAGPGTALHHAPSLTIEATVGVPVRVRWVNDLVDADGRALPHLLPVDPSLHWANPERLPDRHGHRSTDQKPDLTGRVFVPPDEYTDPATQYTTYRGPVPIVTHLHGAEGVGDESDGYTEAWYLPAATDLDPELATSGRWYAYLAGLAQERFGVAPEAGAQTSQYPNHNRASTLWFHDHALGLTRLNVYAGPAGFYLLRDVSGGDGPIRDARTGGAASLPGPAPRRTDPPPGKAYYEIPIAIQDRSFNADGSLFYPDSRTFFDGVTGPWVPESDLSPVWNPEFFGNTLIVNGRVWPHLDVEQRRYRFRVLNGCQSRFLLLDFTAIPGVDVWQIGNDGGLLPDAAHVTADLEGKVLLAPAERADLVVDFTDVPRGEWVLHNVGPDEPFRGGDFEPADAATTGQVLQFRVGRAVTPDRSTPPEHLVLPAVPALPDEGRVRRVALIEAMSMAAEDAPARALLGVVVGDPAAPEGGHVFPSEWHEEVTEHPDQGAAEVWEIYNTTGDAHPIHVHEVAFEVVDRQSVHVEEPPDDGPEEDEHEHGAGPTAVVRISPDSSARGPEHGESGRKDTVIAYPEEVTRIRLQFDTAGRYVWHCHILEHEDHEMMRPLQVGPADPAQPR
ncbi:multicopper oxidase family protein [Intrasporangium calvum]|uniref:Multicopper oxidase type 2 n=1 Tax=Intrasporangium calvum (strain ATCC 23552 / DSM 43043 / JCM 3097 / NBRC 12989 / NCIMB 10167 / NRRL B-3866 / 7 KIP) TaxID=710696 RepID=E6SC96_INTC7|nr:multicopper oxidase domain-containing protein [Intrasporangium calvum]ADU47440.1 multicopper oxidase type 2 [Intrasporangium calvum DSM 43043]